MPIRITDLLRKVEPETERLVVETRQRFNQAVRRHLRDERGSISPQAESAVKSGTFAPFALR